MEIDIEVVPLTAAEIEEGKVFADLAFQNEYDFVTKTRLSQYRDLSDPIFMQYQRGEATEQEWLDAVQAVKDANPYPVKEAK